MNRVMIFMVLPVVLGATIGFMWPEREKLFMEGKYDSQTVAVITSNPSIETDFMPWSRSLNISEEGKYDYLLITGLGSGASWSGQLHVSQKKVSFEHNEFEPFLPEGRKMRFWEKLVLSKSPALYDSMKPVRLDENGSFILFSKFTASVFEKM
ncbi:hypothetical protein [Vibrio coralliilyticus]|uniref:hypothetical protein n=1 Tax=Vibrio coralliilyticus TaxID=190893 RepID=UPI0018296353|nr:hypothetical protein [Vibrio coralliilyticus]NUW69491.1 hypothetical protein [Vibrio coralliilyticus]